jgi:hypothetical protein
MVETDDSKQLIFLHTQKRPLVYCGMSSVIHVLWKQTSKKKRSAEKKGPVATSRPSPNGIPTSHIYHYERPSSLYPFL